MRIRRGPESTAHTRARVHAGQRTGTGNRRGRGANTGQSKDTGDETLHTCTRTRHKPDRGSLLHTSSRCTTPREETNTASPSACEVRSLTAVRRSKRLDSRAGLVGRPVRAGLRLYERRAYRGRSWCSSSRRRGWLAGRAASPRAQRRHYGTARCRDARGRRPPRGAERHHGEARGRNE